MRICSSFLAASLFLAGSLAAQGDAPRGRINFNPGWRFIRGDAPDAGATLAYSSLKAPLLASVGATDLVVRPAPATNPGKDISYVQPGFDDHAWRQLDLPHDWAIEGPFAADLAGPTGRLPFFGVAWYRKTFRAPSVAPGQRVLLNVDGAMAYSAIWLNGQFVGGWPFGWASYQADLTPYLRSGGDNVIAIRLDNPDKSSRWYPGAGLYRNVWLETTAPVHVAHWGTFVTTPEVSAAAAAVSVRVEVNNAAAAPANLTVRTELYALAADGKIAGPAVASATTAPLGIEANATKAVALTLNVANPRRWDLQQRNLYAAITTVRQDGRDVDTTRTDFGIRTIRFDPDNGFFLNGERVQIYGVCNHADLGALGTAVNVRGLERQIQLLQEMGCNAIRTAHNPPAPELLELCDRMGMLVMDESFDTWENPKGGANGYNLLFRDWHAHDLRALVRRDRNHPSVILYSAGNEIGQQGSARGNEVLKELIGLIHQEDPTRMVTTANNTSGFSGQDPADYIYGFNYLIDRYASYRRNNPNVVVIGSETESTVTSRGVYTFPVATGIGEKTANRAPNVTAGQDTANRQVSSYDLYYPVWGNTPDSQFGALARDSGIAGEFVWTGFDYLGEPTPFGGRNDTARSSYFGILDLAGFKKDRFYLYQAQWRPEWPMAHILPHWNWPGRVGQVTPVHVYTSGDEAELFLNGVSQGRRKKAAFEYRLRWDEVVYQPGELRVVAYKNGVKWTETSSRTTGEAAKLQLAADRTAFKADGLDLVYVTLMVADREGVTVPVANNRVKFTLQGPGEIVATDNGDATDLTSFQSPERAAFNGLALAIVRGRPGQPGSITIRAESVGLLPAEVTVQGAP